ncbi:hypothetical protein FDENT_11382 [Fusarium denticulatum]|uniref:NB-ARC domain-containing protein n=1 Tax=Fusarium denticulatum TaxID=48507 RepID=A0A8H5WRW0_9HYPO|nr:hypothetical protein FDENT_11382 [Fusarium denticulatum]
MACKKKGPMFRVTGLSAEQSNESLNATLGIAISDNLSEEEKSRLSFSITVIPSCYNDPERVALVEFLGGVPGFLSDLVANPLGDWQVEMGDTDINFDQHFFGFTQLYTPKADAPVTADIIAITGLDGHAYGSWRGKGNLGRMWLRDFLSKDLPYCRTMIYGYNSKLSSHGLDTIMDYGRELIEELKKIRYSDELRQRPLFFIAHSFGGIILAHCLVKAVQTNEDDHPTIATLHKATYGMLLFGIPHKGLVVDDIQKMLAGGENHPRSILLQQIRDKSDLLAYQLADFKNLIRDRKIVSFYETGQTRQLEFNNKINRWERTGSFITAVDADSALLQLPDSTEEKIPLDSDHSMIVKFDNKNNRGYASARDKLRQFEQDAPIVVATRFLPTKNGPKPSIMIPFQRDCAFVDREDIIAKIAGYDKAAAYHNRIALVGLGGVGKSQIAIEYAYRVKESESQTWVFWVHAANTARFEQAYGDIANKAEIPGREDPKADVLKIVYDWLCDERNGRWLMILDNADDDESFFDHKRPLESFLAQTPNGRVLITSRNRTAALNLVGPCGHIIQVEPMNEEEALTLLNTRVPFSEPNKADAKTLVQALERIPLAITHAAAYIRTRIPMTTISDYLGLFQESEANQMRLLGKEGLQHLRRDNSIRHAVIAAWQISFTQIQKTQKSAADLLALMSMFDRQGIPITLLRNSTSQLDFDDALEPLLSFRLVQVEIGKQSFEMHRLVQLSMRKWLEADRRLMHWTKESRKVMNAVFPSGDFVTWADCQILFPRAKEIMSHSVGDQEDELNHAYVASKTGWFLLLGGGYTTAEVINRQALKGFEKILGPAHPSTLTSIKNLGTALKSQGKYKEAEAIYRQGLEVREKVLGPEHPSTLTNINNLGLVLNSQGKYEEAEEIYQRALKGLKKILGPEHPDTLTSISNLGSVFKNQGKHEEAEVMLCRALEGYEKVLGPEHPDTIICISNLGLVLQCQGKYEEAEAMHRRALEGSEKVLWPEHLSTLTSISNLGLVLKSQGKYTEAKVMFWRVLKGYENIVGLQ